MAYIQFDSNGIVSFPAFAPTGAFTLTLTFTYSTTGNDQYVLSTTANTANYIRCTNNSIDVRVNFTTFSAYGSYVNGEEVTLTISRDAGGNTTIDDGAGPSASQATTNGTFNRLGQNSGGTIIYDGQISAFTTTGGGTDDRTYNFNQAPGSTTLPDDGVGANDGTLSGFTTGGFVSSTLTINSVGDYESKQRNFEGIATFTIAGDKDATNTDIEYSIDGGETWAVLDSPGTALTYSGTVDIYGQKNLSVRYATDPATVASVSYLTSCMHIIAWWQSNCRGQGLVDQTVAVTNTTIVPTMNTNAGFKALADPCDLAETAGGSMWPRVASWFASRGIPVCISNVAVDGTSITQWVSGAPEDYYSRITAADTALGGSEVIISVGGETDSGASMSQATMETNLQSMVSSLNTGLGTNCYICDFPTGDTTGGNPTIWANLRAAYDTIIANNTYCYEGGNLSTIDIDTGTAAGNDGIHLKQTADLNTGADIILAAITGATVNLSVTGIPDGSYRATIFYEGTGERIEDKSITFASGSASEPVGALIPSKVVYAVLDNSDPHVDGAVNVAEAS